MGRPVRPVVRIHGRRRAVVAQAFARNQRPRTEAHNAVRAGDTARIRQHASLADCLASLGQPRVLAFSTRGARLHTSVDYAPGDALLLGPERTGLPGEVLASLPPEQVLRLPMVPGSRSLNLSNAAAVVVFEAWRQHGFRGGG